MASVAPLLRRQVTLARPEASGLAAHLGLAALALLLFRDPVFGGRVLFTRDINMWWLPTTEAFVRCVTSGSWPLWDPWRSFGAPLLADPSREVLYPFTWLNLLLPPGLFYTVLVVFHLAFSAAGLFRLARRWGVSATGAFVGGAVWMLSGPFLALVAMTHHFVGAAWMPWVLLCGDRAVEEGTLRRALLLGLVTAGQILAGSADMVVLSWAGLVFHIAWRYASGRRGGTVTLRAVLRGLGIGLLFATALSAAQWWPSLEVAARSARASLAEADRTTWSLHPASLLEILLRFRWIELPLLPRRLETLLAFRDPWLRSIYLGIPALGLALAALVPRSLPRRGALLVLGAGSVLVALGSHAPVYHALTVLFPPVTILRFPVKAMVLASLAWSLLAALGVEAWRAESSEARRWWPRVVLPLGLAAGLAVAAALAVRFGAERWGPAWVVRPPQFPSYRALLAPAAARLAWGAAAAGAIFFLAWLRARQGKASRALASVAAVLVLADLLAAHWSFHPTAHADLLRRRPEVLSRLGGEDVRIYAYDYSVGTRAQIARGLRTTNRYQVARLPPGWSLAEGLVLGAHAYLNPPTAERWGVRGSYDLDLLGLYDRTLDRVTEALRDTEGTPSHRRLLQMGGVTHVLALHDGPAFADLVPLETLPGFFVEPIRLYRVPDPLPRTYAVGRTREAGDDRGLDVLADAAFDPASTVVLPSPPPSDGTGFKGSTRLVLVKPDRLRVETDFSGPGYAVLTEGYDPGWRATVDGLRAPVLRANLLFRAVAVPAGRHAVEMVYRPRGLLFGGILSLASLGLLVALWTARWQRQGVKAEL